MDFEHSSESDAPRDLMEAHWRGFARGPHGMPVGPFSVRGPASGVILRHGYVVAEWGEPARVDMTFSVSKSFLSMVVGLAVADGLIARVGDRVGPYVPPVLLPAGDGEPERPFAHVETPPRRVSTVI